MFSVEFGRRSAGEGPFDLIRGPLGAQNAFGWAIYTIFWMHERTARVDLGSHGGAAGQSYLRVTSVLVGKWVFCVFKGSVGERKWPTLR